MCAAGSGAAFGLPVLDLIIGIKLLVLFPPGSAIKDKIARESQVCPIAPGALRSVSAGAV